MKSAVEIMALVGLALGIFLIALYWMDLPPKIPSHYNISGQVDKWSAKGSILLLPLVGAFVYALINILSHYPEIFNYPWKFAPQYSGPPAGNGAFVSCIPENGNSLAYDYNRMADYPHRARTSIRSGARIHHNFFHSDLRNYHYLFDSKP